jgi:hypothetical protein
MATERTQNLANHAQWTPAYHFFTVPLGLAYLVWAIRRVMEHGTGDNWFMLLGALALVGAISVSRLQVLKVQDRIIRLEERLRLAALLPADLQPHIGRLRASHLIALRFASDGEVEGLVREIVANPEIAPKEVKRRVKQWRGDWFRA